ncbi:MAG: A24 family peptidase C-terminal domain-containing protein [Sulfolobales archaeon]
MSLSLEINHDIIPISITLITLIIATFYDLKTREIREIIWVPALVFSAVFTYLIIRPSILVFIFSVIPAILLLILAVVGLIGGADFLAILLIGISTPILNVLPISLLTLFYSALIPSALIMYNLLVNTTVYIDEYKKLRCVGASKWLLLFLGKPMKVKVFTKSKFMYPLTVFRCNPNKCDVVCRSSFDIDEDFKNHINTISNYLSNGCIKEDDYIWVTPALPHILFITIGYLLALITPAELIYDVFNLVFGVVR